MSTPYFHRDVIIIIIIIYYYYHYIHGQRQTSVMQNRLNLCQNYTKTRGMIFD